MGEYCCTACPSLETLRKRIFGGKNVEAKTAEGVETSTRDTSLDRSWRFKARFPYESRDDDEISFKEGDLFHIINDEGDWWNVCKIDEVGHVLGSGFVPSSYLERKEHTDGEPWDFGTMSRNEAQSHLMDPKNNNGAFLVRLSPKEGVGYVISVRQGIVVKNFKIGQRDGKFYLDANAVFSSLGDLVVYYQNHQLSTQGTLDQACKKREPSPADLSKATVDEWELPKEEFTLLEQLGRGFFADVHRGCWKNRIDVAIKIIKSESEMNHQVFQREVQILKALRHPNLISLLAVCSASAPYYIITELMQKGNLLSFLRGTEGSGLEVESLIDIAAQVVDGMTYLEEQKCIHRDLAARNVLVGENFICKVADFGLARVIKEPVYVKLEIMIPYKWSAPEVISHGRFSNKSDVWSFGVLLYEIMTHGATPYPALNNQEAYQKVVDGYRMPSPSSCPDVIYSIMLDCWRTDPVSRPDFKELGGQMFEDIYDMFQMRFD